MTPQPDGSVRSGDAFLAPLDDGRWGVVRVIRTADSEDTTSSLVAVTTWIGHDAPSTDDPRVLEILRLRRGRFRGEPAVRWYDGTPPRELHYLGVIPPSAADRAIDPKGAYGGRWHRSMARDVLLECEAQSAHAKSSQKPVSENRTSRLEGCPRITGVMGDDQFWNLLTLLAWRGPDDDAIVAPLIDELAALPEDQIAGFQRSLCDKLHNLDQEIFARHLGAYSFGTEGFSPDHFLDVRCAVVANGRQFYESVLKDPSRMPKDREFEPLLYVAETAFRKKTGQQPVFLTVKPADTFSNRQGWARTMLNQ